MALSKKYAGLVDLDQAPEIYETPELTDDVSTIQTGTLRSTSPSPSEEGRHDPEVGLDRQHIDRDDARRHFDRAVVDARDVDFSDRIGIERKSYRSRRRRYRARTTSDADASSDSEVESIPERLARLQREAEEVRIELEKRDGEQDSDATVRDSAAVDREFAKLNFTLEGLQAPSNRRSMGQEARTTLQMIPDDQCEQTPSLPPESKSTTITAISSFSDRLTSLESALGVSTTLPTTSIPSILPTLTSLSTKITSLSSTLTTSRTHSTSTIPLPTLDDLTTRVRHLVSETDKLTSSRKAALQSLQDLQEARLRTTESTPYGHSRHLSQQSQQLAQQTANQRETESKLFLDEQSSKISALYELLPTIQSLHPLLPTALDRLRSLQTIHAGASEARSDLDEIENRQARIEVELKKWREGLEMVERGMKEHEGVSRANVEVVKGMVEGLESRVAKLSR